MTDTLTLARSDKVIAQKINIKKKLSDFKKLSVGRYNMGAREFHVS